MRASIVVLGMALVVSAAVTGSARGLVYGERHAFFIDAPSGWTLDTKSGVSEGLHAVFYPTGTSWKNAPAVMYVNTAARRPGKTLAAFVQDEIAGFHETNPKLVVKDGEPIAIPGREPAMVRYLSGDQWDNREAIAYLNEKRVFVLFVLTCRTEESYSSSLAAFRTLVGSYDFLTDRPGDATEEFDLIQRLAQDQEKTRAGAAYADSWNHYFAARHAPTLKKCFDTVPNPDGSTFDLLVRIAADGRPLETLVRPPTNVAECLRRAMADDRYPKPPRPRYWFHTAMKITP